MKFAVINQSTLVSDADAHMIARALNVQLAAVAHTWGFAHPAVSFGVHEDAANVVLLDDADQAGAAGYHDIGPDGKPYARVFVRDSLAGFKGVDPKSLTGHQPTADVLKYVAPVASHEAVETIGDVFADDWSEDANGVLWAKELADAVEADAYPVDVHGTEVMVSNWLLPAYFNTATPKGAPVDEMGTCKGGPFTLASGGYAIYQQGGQIKQKFAAKVPAWRKEQHLNPHPGTRTAKRFRKVEEVRERLAAEAAEAAEAEQEGPAPEPETPPLPGETPSEIDTAPYEPAPVQRHAGSSVTGSSTLDRFIGL